MKVHVHAAIADIDADAWDQLLGPEPNPFLRHSFLSLMEQSGSASPQTGWIPRHLAIVEDGLLVAAAPTYVKTHSMGEFVYDWGWAHLAQQLKVEYYPKLVVAVPFSPVVGPRLLTAPGRGELREALVGGLLELNRTLGCHGVHVLFNTPEEAQALEAFGARTRLQTQSWWRNLDYGDFDAFLMEGLPRKRRKEVRRERRRLGETSLRMERVRAPDPVRLQVMSAFYRRTCRMYGGNSYLNDRVWKMLPESPFLEHVQLTLGWDGDEPIAGAFNVQGPQRLYGRYWGSADDRPFLHFEACYYQGIEHCIQEGLQVFEPGHGGRHKKPRGFDPALTHSSHWLVNQRLATVLDRFLAEESASVRARLLA